MPYITRFFTKVRHMIKKILFKIKLRIMDEWWYSSGKSSWSLFPPSFYYTHTEAEIKKITSETIERIRKIIDEL